MRRLATEPACGTQQAYRRHRTKGESPCVDCRAAHASYESQRSGRIRIRARGPLGHFWAKVALPDANGCMLWLGTKTSLGYGSTTVNGKKVQAHRVSLLVAEGPPPDAERVHVAHAPIACHRADCVAPAHLRWATHAENMADKRLDGTEGIGERGHRAKLSEDSVRAIVAGYFNDGRTQLDLAQEYQVSPSTVGDILNGRTWTHLWVGAS